MISFRDAFGILGLLVLLLRSPAPATPRVRLSGPVRAVELN